MKLYTHMNETVLIERDNGEAFLTSVPKAVIDAINYDYFDDFRFCGVQHLRGWGEFEECAAYMHFCGWTIYCKADGKLDKILRPKVLPYQH